MEELFNKLENLKIKTITILMRITQYLENIYGKPYVLYGKGDFGEDSLSIGIVGSRKATSYGKWACENFPRVSENGCYYS